MSRHDLSLGAMAGTIAAMGGTVLQPIRTPPRVKNPNAPADKFAMDRAKQKRERKRLKRQRRRTPRKGFL